MGVADSSGWGSLKAALQEVEMWNYWVKSRDEFKKKGETPLSARWLALAAVVMHLKRETNIEALQKVDGTEVEITPEMFVGKSCTEEEARKWVAENIGYKTVSPLTAPSAIAWFMLDDYKCHPEDFWKVYNRPLGIGGAGGGSGKKGPQTKGNARDVNAMVEAARIVKVRPSANKRGAGVDEPAEESGG